MTKENKVTVSLKGDVDVSDWMGAEANPDFPTAPENVFYRVERGERSDNGKAGFVCEMKLGPDGEAVRTAVMGSVPSAFNAAAQALGMAKGAVAGDMSIKTLFPRPAKGDNNPPEPALTAEELDKADAIMAEIETGLGELAEGEIAVRTAHSHVAKGVHAMRSEFDTKARWAAVKEERVKSAPESVQAVLTNKNAVSLYGRFARYAEVGILDAAPDAMKTPRTFEKEVGSLYTAIAADFASVVMGDDAKARKPFNIAKGKLTNDGLESYLEQFGTMNRADFKDGFGDLAAALVSAHLDNIKGAEADLFTVKSSDGLAKTIASDQSTTLFGNEGRDELVNAVARAVNGFEQAVTVAAAKSEVASDGVKGLAKAINAGSAFSSMDTETAGMHLARILAAKLDDDNVEASADSVDAILSFIGERLDAFRDGSMSKADFVVNEADAPEDAEDADDAADAA